MKHQSHALTIALLTASALGLAACSAEDSISEPSGAATTVTTADTKAAAASAEDDEQVPGEYSTEPTDTFSGELTSELRTVDIRSGSHEGYDRVVFEFEGNGTPEFHAGYSDEPLQQASGLPVDVPGEAALEIMIHGTSLDQTPDAKYAGKPTLGLASGNIKEVTNSGTFESVSQYFIGLDKQRPYKVTVLENPTRVVVDVQK